MEWRCEWCGKPHAEDDPPCDNCGHGSFERAVVPTAPEGDDEGGPIVWVCADCGREHPRNNPPCSRCGGGPLEKQRQSFDDEDPLPDDDGGGTPSVEEMWAGDDDAAVAGETTTVWACADCGRAHPRNNPPCSRCGGMSLEREEREFDEDEDWDAPEPTEVEESVGSDTMTTWVCTECGRSHPRNNPPCSRCGAMSLEQREEQFDDVGADGGGWLDAVDLKVALGFAGALVLFLLVVGSTLGLVTLPGQGVPGSADSAAGLDLATVEDQFVVQINDRRASAGGANLRQSPPLADRARTFNQRVVRAAYDDRPMPDVDDVEAEFEPVDACGSAPRYSLLVVRGQELPGEDLDSFDSAADLSSFLADEYVAEYGSTVDDDSLTLLGVDVHVGPDDSVFVTRVSC